MKRIAFYCGSLTKGGAERVFVNLAEYFLKKGWEVYMVTQYVREDEYEISPAIKRVISEPTEEELSKNRVRNFFIRFGKLRAIYKSISPAVVLSCTGKSNLMSLAANTFLKNRTVLSVVATPTVEYYTKAMQIMAKTFFRFADGTIFQTEEARQFFGKAVQRKSVILPNSLNPLFVKPRFEGERVKEIVAVGRLDENKNHAMLIRAFAGIAEQFPDYTVRIYGEGEKREELESLIESLEMKDRIFLPGRSEAIQDAIYKSSLFVLTSDTEGMPNALIEAMALGLPVISTDCPCGGPREVIRQGENGYLVPVRDVEALKKQLADCLSQPEKLAEVGRNAARIQAELDPTKVNRQWEDYFEQIMKG